MNLEMKLRGFKLSDSGQQTMKNNVCESVRSGILDGSWLTLSYSIYSIYTVIIRDDHDCQKLNSL